MKISEVKQYLKTMLEEKRQLSELNVEDTEMQEAIREFAHLSNEIDRIANVLKQMEIRYKEIEGTIRPIIEELQDTQDKALQVDDILVTIKKKGYERTSYAYKDAYDWLVSRVNPNMRKIVEESLESTKKTSKIAASISVQKLQENRILDTLSRVWQRILGNIRMYNSELDQALQDVPESIK